MATRIRLLIERRLVCRTFKFLLRQIDDSLHLRRRLYGKAEPERLHPVDLRHLIQQIQGLAVEYVVEQSSCVSTGNSPYSSLSS